MLKSKIHGASITGRDVFYEGSILIDASFLEQAQIHEYEEVQVWNRTNGQRFSTYAIADTPGRGSFMVNGAAARLVETGDQIIIAAYCYLDEAQAKSHKPRVLLMDKNNQAKLKA